MTRHDNFVVTRRTHEIIKWLEQRLAAHQEEMKTTSGGTGGEQLCGKIEEVEEIIAELKEEQQRRDDRMRR